MNNKKIASKIFAWSGLLIIFTFVIVIAYALINMNGMLALAAIVALAFISLVYALGIAAYKRILKAKDLEKN